MRAPTKHKKRDLLFVGGGGRGRGDGGGVETSCWGDVELRRIKVIFFFFF